MTSERVYISDLIGTVVECGRSESGDSFVTFQVAKGQHVTLSGISSTMAREFAKALFKPLRVAFEEEAG